MLLQEKVFPVLPCLSHLFITMPQQGAVLHIDGSLERRHLSRIQLLPDILIREEHHAIRMVRQGRHTVGVEVGQEGNSHAAVHVDVPEGNGPPGGITGTDSNLVAFGDAGFVQEQPEHLDVLR